MKHKIITSLCVGLFALGFSIVVSCASTKAVSIPKPVASKTGLRFENERILNKHIRGSQGIAYDTGGKFLFSGGWDNHILVWNAKEKLERTIDDAHESDVVSLAYDTVNEVVVSAGLDRYVRTWNPNTGKMVQQVGKYRKNPIAISTYSTTNASWYGIAVLDGTVRVYDPASRKELAVLWVYKSEYPSSVALNVDANIVAASVGIRKYQKGTRGIYIWDIQSQKRIQVIRTKGKKIAVIALSPDATSRFLVSAGWDNTAIIWDRVSGKKLRVLEGVHTAAIEQIKFSPDGNILFLGARDGLISAWDFNTGELLRKYDTKMKRIYGISVDSRGEKIAVAGFDHSVRVYDIVY